MWLPLYITLCYVSTISCSVSEITVQTSFGEMIGILDDAIKLGNEVRTGLRFHGIPFAKPPTGSRRFEKPEPETSLNTTYNATYFRGICPQLPTPTVNLATMSEDCLYLNVFVPGNITSTDNSFPVMVWIYGGGFSSGASDLYFSDVISSFHDVIVVTMNYRLNVFGFIDDGSGTFANNGLHDQKLAIEWVHNHIQSFGGDPTKVTLFGNSAGAASVMFQVLNPDNRGKVHRAISQSGSVAATWTYRTQPRPILDRYAEKLNCSNSSAVNILSCLRTKSVAELLGALDMSTNFGPGIDGQFMTTDAVSFFANSTRDTSEALKFFTDVDFLIGFNDKDGASSVIRTWAPILNASGISMDSGVPRNIYDTVYIPAMVRSVYGDQPIPALPTAMIHQYINWNDPNNPQQVRGAMVDMSTDFLFLVPAVRAARVHTDNTVSGSTYMYQYSHRDTLHGTSATWLDGADHAMEISHVFGLSYNGLVNAGYPPAVHALIPQTEVDLARAIMHYWTNFAKTGNPNPMNLADMTYPTWPPYTSVTQNYIDLTTDITNHQHPAASRVNFWTNVVPALQVQCVTETCNECQNTETSSSGILTVQLSIFSITLLVFVLQALSIDL